jgi:acetyl-CoA carboxylase carboxyl transferase subunit beta
MNWLTDFVRPKIRGSAKEASSSNQQNDLWSKCPKCEQMIFHRDLRNNLNVCPLCEHHMRLSAAERMEMLFDKGAYEHLPPPDVVEDPLLFKDLKKYKERLKENREKTGSKDAAMAAVGHLCSCRVVLFVMDFNFMGGSMGSFVGQTFRLAAEHAIAQQVPMIAVTTSGGARMQEGIVSLMQMSVSVIAVEMLSETKIPLINILTDPTMGGVSASFAMLGDVIMAEPGALIGFAGPKVIEETIKQTLPAGFQRAEFLEQHGMIDCVVPRKLLREKLAHVLSCLGWHCYRSTTHIPSHQKIASSSIRC